MDLASLCQIELKRKVRSTSISKIRTHSLIAGVTAVSELVILVEDASATGEGKEGFPDETGLTVAGRIPTGDEILELNIP